MSDTLQVLPPRRLHQMIASACVDGAGWVALYAAARPFLVTER